ncbi:universal stress protein [Dactylosporangium sp. CA-233914]|uniref:universal stress protein n=1 Tax=Dactylosporangium sp. CA-233914 TaxID=3239934 RepID=UPI003D8DFA78
MSNRPDSPVVAGVDGTAAGFRAVRLAASEATLRGRPLTLFATHRPQPDQTRPGESGTRHWLAEAESVVREAHPGLSPRVGLESGDLADVLIDASHGAELVAVGETGEFAASERVAAHASAPVLVVTGAGGHPAPDGPIVVGVDGANPWPAALTFAFEEAERRGVTLVPLYAWSGLPDTALSEVDPFAYDLRRAADEADRVLAEALAGWSERYPQVRVRRRAVLHHDPAEALIQASEQAAMLVVSTCSHVGRSEQLLGTVTRRVLHRAPCPVAVLR